LSDPAPALRPRSVAAAADFELLRVARTDLGEPEAPVTLSMAERIRGVSPFSAARQTRAQISSAIRRDSGHG